MSDGAQIEQLKLTFASWFGAAPRERMVYASAPGRLELAGNHTDHQGGAVISSAIDLRVYALAAPAAASPVLAAPMGAANTGDAGVAAAGGDTSGALCAPDARIRVHMDGFGACEIDLAAPDAFTPHTHEAGTPAALIRGMAAAYVATGGHVAAFDMVTASTLPAGAGVSSSAAFEMLVGVVLRALDPANAGGAELTDDARITLALQGQDAERRFFGKTCGAQDQLTSAFGGTVFMDFSPAPPAPPRVTRVPFNAAAMPWRTVLIDSRLDHSRYNADYDAVPQDMFDVAHALGAERLGDAGADAFARYLTTAQDGESEPKPSPRALNRARHFFAETARVMAQYEALGTQNFDTFVRLAQESGRSNTELLCNVVPPSAPADDPQATQPARIMDECARALGGEGACRMHGGGFGGSILAFVRPQRAEVFIAHMNEALGYDACLRVQTSPQGAAARMVDPALPGVVAWTGASAYGTLELTINLQKPEKDPRAIAAAAAVAPAEGTAAAAAARPAAAAVEALAPCDLCREAATFAASRETARDSRITLPTFTLNNERWMLHFSPYGYYPLHCILLPATHRPMRINRACLERLLACVNRFPFYFVGSNADLPIVGGSILSHDHFQGGGHVFPLMRAQIHAKVTLRDFPDVRAGVVHWGASVLRLESENAAALIDAADAVLAAWQHFDFAPCHIQSHTGDVLHNTITPIAYKRSFVDGAAPAEHGASATPATPAAGADPYILDLVLRNNRTTPRRPFGLFHPDESLHHIKKENIGLIEIMGLAILPGRLVREIPGATHEAAVQARITAAFAQILETTGVFKRDHVGHLGWQTFLGEINGEIE